jgi:hypothetical protein
VRGSDLDPNNVSKAAAAHPSTLGGALILLSVGGDVGAASTLQRGFCATLLDPRSACNWLAAAPQVTPFRDDLQAGGSGDDGSNAGFLRARAALPDLLPPKLPGWFSLSDPLEGPSEGVVQSAIWW